MYSDIQDILKVRETEEWKDNCILSLEVAPTTFATSSLDSDCNKDRLKTINIKKLNSLNMVLEAKSHV